MTTLHRLLAVLPLALVACTQSGESAPASEPEPSAAPSQPATAEPATMPDVDLEALAIPYASTPLPGVLAAGQISQDQMLALKEAGFVSFISLRDAGERNAGWEESFAEENGVRFVRLTIAGAPDVDEAHARELGELMDAESAPMVVYCGSSNRVGALFALKAHHVDGAAPEEALELGKSSGVTGLEDHLRGQLGL